jgi:hypothetical protein
MIDFSQLLDAYGRNARLKPALLVLFPSIITIAIWYPDLYTIATGLVSMATACGITLFLTDYARVRGRAIEQHFQRKWGGKPTVILFRHSDATIDAGTKNRYAKFLSMQISGWTQPTYEEEAQDPFAADQRYDSAFRWLLEYTRDKKKFPLLFSENVTYGFRRNVYGLKPIGLTIAVLTFLANAVAIYLSPSFTPAQCAVTVVSFLSVFMWLLIVSEAWVRDAADVYGIRLLAACEQKTSANPRRPSRRTSSSKTESRPEKV